MFGAELADAAAEGGEELVIYHSSLKTIRIVCRRSTYNAYQKDVCWAESNQVSSHSIAAGKDYFRSTRMKLSRMFCVVVMVLTVIGFTAGDAEACSCFSGGPVCQGFFNTPVVFSGRVTAIEEGPRETGGKIDWQPRIVKFAVNAHYRGGGIEQSVEVRTGMGGGDCGYRFEVGEDYLVYAHSHENRLSTGICTPTKPLDKATEDLNFISSLSSAKPVGSIFGGITEWKARRSSDEYRPNPPIPALVLTLKGEGGEYSATTDSDGKYSFSEVQPGSYVIQIAAPEGFSPFTDQKLNVAAKGCVNFSTVLSRETSASGRVLDANGVPVTRLMLDLVPVDEIDKPHQRDRRTAQLDENGYFKFIGIPPGSYYLGIGLGRWTVTKHAFPKTFYPGTPDISRAAVLIVKEADMVRDLDFQLPPTMKEQKVTGRVVFPDGKPAANAMVIVKEGDVNDPGNTASDKEGKVTLYLYEGLTYKVKAVVQVNGAQRHAEWVPVPASDPVKAFKIVITEPNGNCSRCLR